MCVCVCVCTSAGELRRHSCVLWYYIQTVLSVLWKVWSSQSVIDYLQPEWATPLGLTDFSAILCICVCVHAWAKETDIYTV